MPRVFFGLEQEVRLFYAEVSGGFPVLAFISREPDRHARGSGKLRSAKMACEEVVVAAVVDVYAFSHRLDRLSLG